MIMSRWTSSVVACMLMASCLIMAVSPGASRQAVPADDRPLFADVRAFGAVGDGRADDTPALQRAIDAGLGRVVIPKGRFRLTRPLVVDLHQVGYTCLDGQGAAVLVMDGSGPALRFTGSHFRSADPENFSPEVWRQERMPMVERLAIEGAHDEADGIEAVGTMQLTISRVHIRRARHAIRLRENNRNILICDSHLYENRGVGIYYDQVNLHQSNIVGCHISYNRGGGIVCRGGNVRNIHVSGCDLESNMAPDLAPTANILIDCSDSAYGTGEVAITGCTIQHNNPSPDSANIRILGRSHSAADGRSVREGNVAITGNVLSDVQVNVHLRDCRGVTLTGNTMWQGYRYNMLLEGCSSLVLAGNNLDRNPRYDYGNTADANNGVVFRDCEDCNITGLHLTQVWRCEAGLLLENCRRVNIGQCTILDCDRIGLCLRNVSDSRVSDCLIRDDRAGADSLSLVVAGGGGIGLYDNTLGRPSQIDAGAVLSAE